MDGRTDNPEGELRTRPVIAITLGDPLGIGPEITVKALADRDLRRRAHFRIFGSARAMDAPAAAIPHLTPFWWRIDHRADDAMIAAALHHDVLLLDYPEFDASMAESDRRPTRAGGAAGFRWVEDAIAAAQRPPGDPRRVDAIVTAPISKASWHLAGHTQFPGHTELLAARFKARHHGMLFVGPSLRVILVTVHIPLAAVRDQLTTPRILDAIELADRSCREMGISLPRIAVCGLNPHAGEGGILGDEDDRLIAPAVAAAVKRGVDATGPWPADTVFLAAAAPPHGKGRFDCVVAMYHDQGLIPAKLIDAGRTVNVTVGLPTVRTSPAHGTAFDIAGQNKADSAPMRAAIELALKMVAQRSRSR